MFGASILRMCLLALTAGTAVCGINIAPTYRPSRGATPHFVHKEDKVRFLFRVALVACGPQKGMCHTRKSRYREPCNAVTGQKPSKYVQQVVDFQQGLRRLRQEVNATEVTAVYSEEDLFDAIVGGAQHIVIRQHLDLSTMEPLSDEALLNQELKGEPDFGKSIQVCSLHTPSSLLI